jgi:hypothetical protein
LLSQGEASIAFCQASAHYDGSGSLSPSPTFAFLNAKKSIVRGTTQ